MIDSITAIGVNGTQVQINTGVGAGFFYPLEHFEVTYDVTSDDDQKSQEHGTWQSPDYIGNGHLLLEGKILALSAADYWPRRFTLMSPFIPLPQQGFNQTTQLILQLTGWADTLTAYCNLDGSLPNPPLTSEIPAVSDFQINLKLRDPRFYGSTIQSIQLTPPASEGGLTFPMTFPITFDSATTSQAAAFNGGNAYTDPTWTITGPCNDPRVYVARADGTTDTWALNGLHIPAGSTVVANFADKTVIMDGVYSQYRYVQSNSKWWQLYNGNNIIGFTALNADPTVTATCTWQNAYFL